MCKKTNNIVGKIIHVDRSRNNMKQTLGLGIGSMAGLSAMGSIPQPAGAGNTIGTVSGSLNMLNTGQMAKNAMGITKMISGGKKKHGKHY